MIQIKFWFASLLKNIWVMNREVYLLSSRDDHAPSYLLQYAIINSIAEAFSGKSEAVSGNKVESHFLRDLSAPIN